MPISGGADEHSRKRARYIEPSMTPDASPSTQIHIHTPPPPFKTTSLEILTQGAEALVYKTEFLTPNTPVVVKYRPPKPYRHPTLDRRLTKQRLLAEARVLIKCKKEGVNVPGVVAADWDNGWLVLEFIEGRTVRKVLDAWAEGVSGRRRKGEEESEQTGKDGEMIELMGRVGRMVGKLHERGVCHGDLTTSNLMLRTRGTGTGSVEDNRTGRQTTSALREDAMSGGVPQAQQEQVEESESDAESLDGDVYLIDFGLTTATIQDEDRAVDLYVLERAFAATHPAAEPLFQEVLKAYGESYKGARTVLKRLEGVRLRGRKRSMLG